MEHPAFSGLALDKRATDVLVPFAISCECGAILRGQRQSQAQTVHCPSCQKPRFVLPRSPCLPVDLDEVSGKPGLGNIWQRRRWPLIAAGAIAVLAVIGLTIIAYFGFRTPGGAGKPPLTAEQRFAEHFEKGRTAFAEGWFQTAATELQAALAESNHLPGKLTLAERRESVHQQRQAAILADLLTVPLADAVRQAMSERDPEWQAVFFRQYLGRSVILDDTLHCDANRQFHIVFQMRVPGAECKIDLKSLRILSGLESELARPQRVLLGFRLAGIRRDGSNGWTILPDPDSGVFLTDPQVLSGLPIPPDTEMTELLKRQKVWVEQ